MPDFQIPTNGAGVYRKKEVTKALQIACGQAYGFGAGFALNTLAMFILEYGIPSREEREAIVAARLAEEDDTAE